MFFDNLACGYYLPESRMQELKEYVQRRNFVRIDLNTLIEILKYHKQLDLQKETEKDLDEYVDAFVAMGGNPD